MQENEVYITFDENFVNICAISIIWFRFWVRAIKTFRSKVIYTRKWRVHNIEWKLCKYMRDFYNIILPLRWTAELSKTKQNNCKRILISSWLVVRGRCTFSICYITLPEAMKMQLESGFSFWNKQHILNEEGYLVIINQHWGWISDLFSEWAMSEHWAYKRVLHGST